MVISQWILERGIGNRGSKSNNTVLFVKEQRVYGKLNENFISFKRCILSSFERNDLLRLRLNNTICNRLEHGILSNQINILHIIKCSEAPL